MPLYTAPSARTHGAVEPSKPDPSSTLPLVFRMHTHAPLKQLGLIVPVQRAQPAPQLFASLLLSTHLLEQTVWVPVHFTQEPVQMLLATH